MPPMPPLLGPAPLAPVPSLPPLPSPLPPPPLEELSPHATIVKTEQSPNNVNTR